MTTEHETKETTVLILKSVYEDYESVQTDILDVFDADAPGIEKLIRRRIEEDTHKKDYIFIGENGALNTITPDDYQLLSIRTASASAEFNKEIADGRFTGKADKELIADVFAWVNESPGRFNPDIVGDFGRKSSDAFFNNLTSIANKAKRRSDSFKVGPADMFYLAPLMYEKFSDMTPADLDAVKRYFQTVSHTGVLTYVIEKKAVISR